MKLNRRLLMVLALVMSLAMATTGTLAFLTDRDTVENTFTMGNVDIEVEEIFPDDEMLPGVEVEKQAGIKNTHATSEAWVWMTVSVPADLDEYLDLKWDSSVAEGDIVKLEGEDAAHEGYVSYLVKHPTALKPGESTPKYLQSVTLSPMVDYQNGKYVAVKDGVPTELTGLEDLKVYVDGFAMQTEGMADVEAAYTAYTAQWKGLNGGESGVAGSEDEKANGDDETVTYEIPADAYKVTNSEELKQAVADGATTLLLAAGEYDIDGCTGKTLSLYGEDKDKTIITIVGTGAGEANGQLDYGFDGSTVTFTNLTIESNNQTYAGYARLKGTYKDVHFINTYCLNGDSAFEYCTFDISGDQYNIWTWGADNATFDHCTFNSDGKAILLYGTANTKLTVNNSVFNDNGGLTDLKAAIEIGNDYSKSYELIVNNTTVNGYEINDKGISTGTTLWGNKSSMGTDKLNVVVDGVDVY